MKPYLNDKNKKWVLTFSLLVALGFNLSPSIRSVGSASFASTQATTTINDQKYLLTGIDDKTTSVVSINAEGKVCTDCDSYVLDAPLKDKAKDLGKLEKLLAQQIPDKDDAKSDDDSDHKLSAEEQRAKDKQDKRDQKLEDDRKVLARILKDCHVDDGTTASDDGSDWDKKKVLSARNVSPDQSARCLVTGYISKLNDSIYKIDPAVAEEFFQANIQPAVLAMVDSQLPSNSLFGSTTGRQSNTANMAVADLLRRVASSVNGNYNNVRVDAKNLADQVVKDYALKAVSEKNQAQQLDAQANLYSKMANQVKNNPQQYMQMMQQSLNYQGQAATLRDSANATYLALTSSAIPNLMGGMESGLQVAVNQKFMGQMDAQSLLNGFQTDSSSALAAMSNGGLTNFAVPNLIGAQQQTILAGNQTVTSGQTVLVNYNGQTVQAVLVAQPTTPVTNNNLQVLPVTQATVLQAAPANVISGRTTNGNLPMVRQAAVIQGI